jgi:hypothetical protein
LRKILYFSRKIRFCYWLFDIKGQQSSISNVKNRVTDMEVSCLRYHDWTNTLQYRMLISFTISKVTLTFVIKGHVITYLVQYRIQYSIQPMPFTAERKLPLPRFYHSCAERHVPWIPAESCTLFAQFHSLIHRDLTRKGPSIVSHPHVDFEPPALSPTVGSRICCSFLWYLTTEAARNCLD